MQMKRGAKLLQLHLLPVLESRFRVCPGSAHSPGDARGPANFVDSLPQDSSIRELNHRAINENRVVSLPTCTTVKK